MESQDKLTSVGDQKVKVVGVILAESEGLETVQHQRLAQVEVA